MLVTDHPDWKVVTRLAADCEAGRCKYAPGPDREPHPWVNSTTHCSGWAGFAHAEGDVDFGRQIVMRWRPCDRHAAWWAAERARIRERKARAAA
jgi:hypothetical protein